MSNLPACGHRHIVSVTVHDGTLSSERWECRDCRLEFEPKWPRVKVYGPGFNQGMPDTVEVSSEGGVAQEREQNRTTGTPSDDSASNADPERMTVRNVGADGGGDYWEVEDGGKPILGIVDYPNENRVFGTWNEDGEWQLLDASDAGAEYLRQLEAIRDAALQLNAAVSIGIEDGRVVAGSTIAKYGAKLRAVLSDDKSSSDKGGEHGLDAEVPSLARSRVGEGEPGQPDLPSSKVGDEVGSRFDLARPCYACGKPLDEHQPGEPRECLARLGLDK